MTLIGAGRFRTLPASLTHSEGIQLALISLVDHGKVLLKVEVLVKAEINVDASEVYHGISKLYHAYQVFIVNDTRSNIC